MEIDIKSLFSVDDDDDDKCANNLNIITRNGMDTNNIEISKLRVNNQGQSDISCQKAIFKDATKIFEELSKSDVRIGNSNKTLNELLQLLTKEEVVDRLIDLLYEVRQSNTSGKIQKTIYSLGKSESPYLDPLVDLVVNGYNIRQVVVDFGSQVNVLPRSTWIKIGRPQLQESGIYIRLVDQGLIAPIGVLKKVETSIMGITKMIDYEVIDIQDEKHTYPALVGQPWG